MAQRYHDDMSHWRMDNGNCPECGEKPAQHLSDSRFWISFRLRGGIAGQRIGRWSRRTWICRACPTRFFLGSLVAKCR